MHMLEHYLNTLKLPTFLKNYTEIAEQCKAQGSDYSEFLLRLSEMEVLSKHSRMVQQRIKQANFPVMKTLDSFDFKVVPSLEQRKVVELTTCEYVNNKSNVIALGNSGTGKTHISIALGMAACQKGITTLFVSAATLVNELLEAREERHLLRLQNRLNKYQLLIIDELGFVPFSKAGAELLFEVFSNRYEQGSIIVTSNLPFQDWTQVFGCQRLTGALLDRLTHHVHILEQ